MKRKAVIISAALLIGVGGFFGSASFNEAEASLKQELKEIQGKKSEINSEKKTAEAQLSENRAKQEKVEADIKRLDQAVGNTQQEITKKANEIAETKVEIEQLKKEIVELEKQIEKRDELLKDRVRSVQENGGAVSYLEVLLGARSFGDFIDRITAVTTIVAQDKDILKQHQEDKVTLEEKKVEVDKKLESLETKRAELERLEKQLKTQIDEKGEIMKDLKKHEGELENEAISLQEQASILSAQERAIKAEIKREEEARRQQQASGQAPKSTNGTWMRPANGPITSSFGRRSFGDGWHDGVDIGKRASTVPIVAAADGTVIRSYLSSSYGNAVFITHRVNGQIYTTVYAHMTHREVSTGQSVKKGQVLGNMGNTGRSFGAHLHFELHKGPWNYSKSNAVNPTSVIRF